ncbi:hypothetical protein ACK3SF_00950 [Candidatus Nanosalina sp. VS9-1]|uniref:hypothetical protein n=1 Tax=Candidatus Nanosalina sp. VS9-1 TaxID=3388566 RepID=UPI0039E13998
MDTTELSWQKNREDYLKKAYAAVNADNDPVPLNEAVENWNMLTGEASKHFFWKSLGLFRINDSLDIIDDSGDHLIDIDTDISLEDLQEDIELVPGDGRNVRKHKKSDYRGYGDLSVPEVPLFIAWEHLDRNGYEIFPYEDPELRGLAGRTESSEGAEEKWLGFYSHDGRKQSSSWINQVFRGLTVEGEDFLSTEDVFSDRNAENYVEKIWESEPLKIRQRLNSVWDAALETVEEELPRRVEEYEDRWGNDIDEREALKREMRLMAGDDEFREDGAYIERIVHGYWDGELERYSPVLDPFLENIESTPLEEGDMPYGEAVRGSETSEGKKERNRMYMQHFLDLVWQMSEERYS